MSASETEIANFALSHLGSGVLITSLDERVQEARSCTLWYAQCRDEMLRDFAWPWALVRADLALVAAAPNTEWGYSYTAPSGFLRLVRAPYGSVRNPTIDTATKYLIEGGYLFTDQDLATILYVSQITDTTKFPPDFVTALSYLLASRIAPTIVKEARATTQLAMYQMAQHYTAVARANALNEQAADVEPDSGFLTARA